MGAIEQSFNRLQRENPNHSSFINFCRAVESREFSMSVVMVAFDKLVDKNDWRGQPWDEVVSWLKQARACQKTLIPSPIKMTDLRKTHKN